MPKLDIHPASETERIAAYRNVHDVWSGGLDLEAHVARRLQSVQHNRADWFVGTLDGDVVTSLACYPLMFQLDGDNVPGIALGSVHTRADCRRRGFAGELIAWVEEHQQRRGVVLSLLYSDIDPRYYARLGYQECPSWEGSVDPRDVDLTALPIPGHVTVCPVSTVPAETTNIYDACHAGLRVHIRHDDGYWTYLSSKQPSDEFLQMTSSSGRWSGYVRITPESETWQVNDWATADPGDESASRLLATLMSAAAQRGVLRVEGWWPPLDSFRAVIPLTPRRQEITMLKSLDSRVPLEAGHLNDAQYFRAIDHV